MEKFRILSLDGGGIRGVITAVILVEIERKLGKKLQDHFHLIAGTSTGSILAVGIASGYTAKKLLEIYKSQGRTIFPQKNLWNQDVGEFINRWKRAIKEGISGPQYSHDGLIQVLKNNFNESNYEKTLIDLNKNLVLITSYDAFSRKPVLICNWLKEWAYLPIWKACVSSASAPTFFPSFYLDKKDIDTSGSSDEFNLIDGGVFANNPTTCTVTQAIKLCALPDKDKPKIVENPPFPMPPTGRDQLFSALSVLSVGTGKYTRKIRHEESKNWGTLEWIAPLIDVMFDGSNVMNDKLVECLIGDSKSYLRLQPILSKDKGSDDIDDASPKNIEKLIQTATDYLKDRENQVFIDDFLSASS